MSPARARTPSASPSATRPASSRSAKRWLPVIAATIIALAAAAAGLVAGDTTVEGWQLAARWTARTAAAFFLIVFVIGPVWRMGGAPWITPFMRIRRHWGLAFAAAHTVHLGALTIFYAVSPLEVTTVTVIFGGFAYVLILAMSATSNRLSKRAMGRWWDRMHLFGMIYIWVIFTQSYAGRLADPESLWVGVIGTGLFVAAMLLRIGVSMKTRMQSRR